MFVCLVVFSATFNNSSVISWRSVLLMEETVGPGENHRGKDRLCVWSSLIDKFRVVWQQGDIYYKPKTRFKNCNIWNWILWVVVFRLQFCFIGDGGLLQFFLLVMGIFHNFFYWWWGSFTIFFFGDGGVSQFLFYWWWGSFTIFFIGDGGLSQFVFIGDGDLSQFAFIGDGGLSQFFLLVMGVFHNLFL